MSSTSTTNSRLRAWVATVVLSIGLYGVTGVHAQQPVSIADPTTPTQKAAVNGSGQLSITCANCTGSGASAVDESTFTQGTNSVAPAGILFKTSYAALTSGQVGVLRGFSDGSLYAMGSVASGAADSGNPLKVGGVYNSSPITLTTGQRGDVQLDANGYTKVNIAAGGSATVTEAATITANQSNEALTAAVLYGFDGSTDSRLRTRAGTINSADVGLVTRPFLASDGTNTQPAMDAAARPGFQKITDGTNTRILDPCESSAATISYIPISQTASSVIKAGTSAKRTYICAVDVVGADAENLSFVEGTGSVCATGIAAVIGGTTAAAGWNFAANGGIAKGNGASSIAATATNADDLCLLQSGSGRVSGSIKVAVQ